MIQLFAGALLIALIVTGTIALLEKIFARRASKPRTYSAVDAFQAHARIQRAPIVTPSNEDMARQFVDDDINADSIAAALATFTPSEAAAVFTPDDAPSPSYEPAPYCAPDPASSYDPAPAYEAPVCEAWPSVDTSPSPDTSSSFDSGSSSFDSGGGGFDGGSSGGSFDP